MYFHYLDRAAVEQLLDRSVNPNNQGFVPQAILQPDRLLVGHQPCAPVIEEVFVAC